MRVSRGGETEIRAWQLLVPEPVVKMQEATIQRAKEAEMP